MCLFDAQEEDVFAELEGTSGGTLESSESVLESRRVKGRLQDRLDAFYEVLRRQGPWTLNYLFLTSISSVPQFVLRLDSSVKTA